MKKKSLIGKRVHIVSIINNVDYYGVVTNVDEQGRVSGTWGNYVADSRFDHISLE
jgi:hypothetical protein